MRNCSSRLLIRYELLEWAIQVARQMDVKMDQLKQATPRKMIDTA
jgi:hypothetical protein